ncbi:MAG TPA: phosphocholine cytidylyltransferase family protein [Ohtaekwangia sp.]|nr:phosphocholine cytidylyltransferase family protein [Ohtaekwangia sp.]
MKIVILAAGIGSRLGNPLPKPLTFLKNGKTIMQQQIDNLTTFFDVDSINIVVGFKKEMIMESFPDITYIYNQVFDQTNTSKSLLKALKKNHREPVMWLNGDVVFDTEIIRSLMPLIVGNKSFVCVNNQDVAEEEVKYTLDGKGFIKEISKQVKGGIGEAVGINFVSSKDINALIARLEECNDNDYFERGIELAIQKDGVEITAVDISQFRCMEIDFKEDLDNANKLF